MASSSGKIRMYSCPDSEMFQSSRVMHGFFAENIPVFVEFDASFADPFAEEWQNRMNEVTDFIQDQTYLGSQTELTKGIETKLQEIRNEYKNIKYFIEQAFPGQKSKWMLFGLDDYSKVQKSQTAMIRFLGVLYKAAVDHKDKLIEAGYSLEKINRLSALQRELIDADSEQEIAKKKRAIVTQERVKQLNDLYKIMQKVSKAGKIIYPKEDARYRFFLLPGEEKRTTQPEPQPNP